MRIQDLLGARSSEDKQEGWHNDHNGPREVFARSYDSVDSKNISSMDHEFSPEDTRGGVRHEHESLAIEAQACKFTRSYASARRQLRHLYLVLLYLGMSRYSQSPRWDQTIHSKKRLISLHNRSQVNTKETSEKSANAPLRQHLYKYGRLRTPNTCFVHVLSIPRARAFFSPGDGRPLDRESLVRFSRAFDWSGSTSPVRQVKQYARPPPLAFCTLRHLHRYHHRGRVGHDPDSIHWTTVVASAVPPVVCILRAPTIGYHSHLPQPGLVARARVAVEPFAWHLECVRRLQRWRRRRRHRPCGVLPLRRAVLSVRIASP